MRIDEKSETSLEKEYVRLHLASEKALTLALVKYKCAAGFSFVMDQEMPPFPKDLEVVAEEGPHWAGGRFYAFMQRHKRISLARDLDTEFERSSFAGSLLMLKKGMPRPTPNQCMQSSLAALETMTTPQTRTASELLVIDRVGSYCERVVDKLFGEVDFSQWLFAWPSVSSHSSCSSTGENSTGRSNDGAFGYLRDNQYLPNIDLCDYVEDEEQISQEGERHYVLSSEAVSDLIRRQALLVEESLSEFPQCFPQALPEAAKVRVVTAGPVKMYHALRPVQHLLHRVVASDPRFAIANPLDGKQILSLLGRLGVGEKWISGDYKAATDNLAMELSVRIGIRIAARCRMPASYTELLIRSLTGHYYLDRSGDVVFVKPQARGQLMGSVTSFPILCIANFALIWATLDFAPDMFPLPFEEVKCIVNGDDCLFPATDRFYDEWKENAAAVGLSPSVGKTYVSQEFMVINSEMYSYHIPGYDPVECPFGIYGNGYPYIPCVNSGLLVGMKRSGNRETSCQKLDDRSQTIGARCTALVRGWSYISKMRNSLIRSFIACNLDLFPDKLRYVPLHLFERWGGYGIPMASEFEPSNLERSKWVSAFNRDFRRRWRSQGLSGPLTQGTQSFKSLKSNTDVKRSPFYKECAAYCRRKFGTVWSDRPWSGPGPLQWCFKDKEIPEVTDDNLIDFVHQWNDDVHNFAPFTSEAFNNAYEWIDSRCPLREIPGVTFKYSDTDFRVIGWSPVVPVQFHHPDFGQWTGCSGGSPTFFDRGSDRSSDLWHFAFKDPLIEIAGGIQ